MPDTLRGGLMSHSFEESGKFGAIDAVARRGRGVTIRHRTALWRLQLRLCLRR
jgi:hypothetical protein